MVLFRAVDIGAELLAMSAACARAVWLERQGEQGARELADLFCAEARQRIEQSFRVMHDSLDAKRYRVAMSVLKGEHEWLEEGIVWGKE